MDDFSYWTTIFRFSFAWLWLARTAKVAVYYESIEVQSTFPPLVTPKGFVAIDCQLVTGQKMSIEKPYGVINTNLTPLIRFTPTGEACKKWR